MSNLKSGLTLFTLVGLFSCNSGKDSINLETGSDTDTDTDIDTDTDTDTGEAQSLEPKVLMVMIDGFISDVIPLTDTPAMDRLLQGSAWSMEARAESTTISGSGWASFLTGVHWDKHGVPDNSFSEPNFEAYPHVFSLLREAVPDAKVAGCQSWEPIEEGLVEPSNPDFHSFYDYYQYSSDYFDEASPDRYCGADMAEWAATSDADLYVVMFGDTDGVGHGYGYGADYPYYQQEITEVDGFILDILESIDSRSTRAQEDWVVIITGDHSGEPSLHHGYNIPDHRLMPLIVSGDAVVPGEIWPAPKAVDVVPTALAHLGVDLAVWPEWDLDGVPVGFDLSGAPEATLGTNLVFNGDAEFERGYDNYTGRPDAWAAGWYDPDYLTVIEYDSPDGFPAGAGPGPEDRGINFFAGGGVGYDTEIRQFIDVESLALSIDSGASYTLSGWLGGYANQNDRAEFEVRFLEANGTELSTATIGPVGAQRRGGETGLLCEETQGTVPQGTRQMEVVLTAKWSSGYNDGYADNLSVVFADPADPFEACD